MNYERTISEWHNAHDPAYGGYIADDVAVIDGRTFRRYSETKAGLFADADKQAAIANVESRLFVADDDKPNGVICECGETKFSLSYGSYELFATCDCGRKSSVYSG